MDKEAVDTIRRRDIPMQMETGGTQNNTYSDRPSDDFLIKEIFTYHSPNPYQAKAYENLRSAAKHLAEVIIANVPSGADRTAALRKLRESVMTANAGISLNGLSF